MLSLLYVDYLRAAQSMPKVVVEGGEEGNFHSWWYHGGRNTATWSVGDGAF